MTITLLNSRYQIIQVLGGGGFGETFLAEDTYLPSRRRCVIKQLKPMINDPQMYQLIQERFQREAAILEKLGDRSDQIPQLYAYFCEEGQFYLVQEWIQGQTVSSMVEVKGLFSETAVKDILVNLLSLLDYVHSEGIIHRDIKPDNIILRHLNGKPVLIDFGAVKETIAKVGYIQGKLNPSMVFGTPGFMSPEQAAGRPSYTSDLYSLGMTAIYMLTGKLPQQLDIDPQTGHILWQQYARKVSPNLIAVLDKAIQSHPRDRYTTARKMLLDISQSDAYPPNPPTQATVVLSPNGISQPTPVNSPQTALANKYSFTQASRQKNLFLGSLIAGGLFIVVILVGLVRQPPQSTAKRIATTPHPNPTTATVDSPPRPTAPQQNTQPRTPQVIATPPPNKDNQNASSNAPRDSVPGFPVGISETKVKTTLGKPTKISKGLWYNTQALLYEDIVPNRVSLGYLFDRTSGRLRQSEVAFASSVDPEVMQATLKEMLGDRTFINISQGLQSVYQRRTNKYSFNMGKLKGAIQRNQRDRIYIAVWDASLH